MNEPLTAREQRAWKSLIAAKTQLIERLDHELQHRAALSLTDYEILSVLSEAPERKARMSELADQALVSRSRLTYRIDRLTHLGFVGREECEDDKRGLYAILTDRGEEVLRWARPRHLNDVRTWFLDLVEPDELDLLESIMNRIGQKLSTN